MEAAILTQTKETLVEFNRSLRRQQLEVARWRMQNDASYRDDDARKAEDALEKVLFSIAETFKALGFKSDNDAEWKTGITDIMY